MITLEEITAGTLDRLDALGRTEDADPWVVEVEDFVIGPGPAEVLRTGDGQVLLALAENQPVGVALHRPHDQFIGGQLLSLVGRRRRGRVARRRLSRLRPREYRRRHMPGSSRFTRLTMAMGASAERTSTRSSGFSRPPRSS